MKYVFIVMLVSSVSAFADPTTTGTTSTDVCTKVSSQKCDAPKKMVNGVCTSVDASGAPVTTGNGTTDG